MKQNYRFSHQCCGNNCGTNTVNQTNNTQSGRNTSGRFTHWIAAFAILLSWIAEPQYAAAQSCGSGLDTYSYCPDDPSVNVDLGPVGNYQYRSYRQFIYEKGSVCKGIIKKISFRYRGSVTMTRKTNVTIWIGETTKSQFSSTTDWVDLSNMQQVYSGPLNCNSNSWNYFTLTGTGFNFSGTKNLVVAILDNSGSREGNGTNQYGWYYDYGNTDKVLIYNGNVSDELDPENTTYTGTISNCRPCAAFCVECKNCDDRTGSITFSSNPFDVTLTQYSANNNIATNTVSPSGVMQYSSANTSIATVDPSTGIVHGVAGGSTTITVTIPGDGTNCEYTASYTVNISCVEPVFQWSATSFTAGQSTTTFPELISNHPQTPTYTSSSTGVATINSAGVITITGTGTTTIRASVPASGDTCSATAQYTLTVEGPCTPSFDDTRENYYIRNFTATGGTVDINNTSLGTANTYSDYYDTRNLTTLENAATTISFSITAVGGNNYGAAIWVDYNGDGVFSNAERVWRTASAQTSPITGSFTVPASATRQEYRMRVLLDGDNPSPSDPCNIHQGEVEDYKIITPLSDCANPQSQSYISQHIDRVTTTGGISNINNQQPTTSPTVCYTDFYNQHSLTAYAGSFIGIDVDLNTFSGGYIAVWVDWNNDGTFDNATERVLVTGGAASYTPSGSFTIPSWVQPGEYRMRIMGSTYTTYLNYPCGGSYVHGEYEDYKIVVTQPTLTYANGNCTDTYTGNPDPQQGYGHITLSPDVPSCSSGNTFAGWNTMADGSGQFYQPNGTYYLTSDATLYAIFQPECCVPSNAVIQYTHGGKTDTAQLADDGYFYYDLCKGETLNATLMNIPGESCGYSNHQWRLDSVGTVLETSTAVSLSHTFNAEYGYNLNLSASSSAGCTLAAKGRVRVSGGIHSLSVSDDHFSFCPGNVKPVSIGYEGSNSHVTVNKPGVQIESTLGHANTIFLPDGVPCDPDGDGISSCSYVSSVTFTQFSTDAVVRDYNDILYLRMNMEHTYIGDLYIALVCPDGNTATVLNFGGNNNSDCASEIPAGHLNWTGSSAGSGYGSHGGYMGNPNTSDATTDANLCNTTINQPGTGWNYVWSNNDNRGYTYAGGEQGFIYNNANMHSMEINNNHSTVDSSNLAEMSQIYHPEESFANLVGCHLNGEWKIIVIDGFKQDNGYLFEWDLALSEDLMPENWGYTVALDTAWAACNWSGGGAKFNNFSVEVPVDFAGGDVSCILNYIDEYGCETNDDITLHFDIGELSATVTPSNATCGRDNGQIAITSPAGEGPFYYSINGGDERTVPLFTGLAVGHYTVRVRDSRDCYTDYEVDIDNEGDLSVTGLASTYTICEGSSVTLSASSSGGTGTPANYTWSWSPATGLSATNTASVTANPSSTQTYTVTVEDESECQASATVTVTVNPRPSAEEIVITHDREYVCNMSGIGLHTGSSTATGGTPPYSYEWGTDVGTINPIPTSGSEAAAGWGVPISGNTTQYVVNYWLIVSDANGCRDTSYTSVDVYPLPSFSVYGQSPHCLGEDVDLSVIGLTGGTPPYNDAYWSSSDAAHAGLPLPATGSPITATPNAAGTYTYSATVNDSKCSYTANVNITFFDNPNVSDIVYNPPTCNGGDDGSIVVTVVDVPAYSGSYIEVQLNDADANSHSGNVYTWTGLSAGTYTLDLGIRYTTGSKVCNSTQELTLSEPDPVEVTATASTTVCLGGEASLEVTGVTGGSGNYVSYVWTAVTAGNSNPTPTGTPSGITATATPSTTGEVVYRVTVSDDNGCTGYTDVTVTVNGKPEVSLAPVVDQCPGATDVEITANITTATSADYTYTWQAASGVTLASPTTHTRTHTRDTIFATMPNSCGLDYTITLYLEDAQGCKDTATTTVTVRDTEKPVISIASSSDPAGVCNPTITAPTFTGTDNCEGDISSSITVTTLGPSNTGCSYTQTWTANYTDACGNAADEVSVTYTWTQDTEKPVIATTATSGDKGCNPTITAPTFTGTDNCEGDISSSITVATLGPTNTGCSYTQTWTANYTDACGNAADEVSVTYTWTQDTEKPVIATTATSGDKGCNPTITAPTFTGTDNCDGDISGSITVATLGPTNTGCSYTQTWTANYTDACGNAADEVSVTYTWTESTVPTIATALADDDLGCNPSITAPTASDFTVTDACAASPVATVTTTGPSNTGCSYTQTWTANYTNACDQDAVPVSVTYTWTESTVPTIATALADDDLGCNPTITAPTASDFTVTDDCAASPVVTVTTDGAAHTGCNYTQTWTANYTNACSLDATPVTVTYTWRQDTEGPEAAESTITRATVQCVTDTLPAVNNLTDLQALGFSFTEDCGGSVMFVGVQSNKYEGTTCSGVRTTVYRVKDACENTTDVTYIQPVNDNQPPTIIDPSAWPSNVTGQDVCVRDADLSVFLSETEVQALYEDCNTITVTYSQETVIDKCDWTVTRTYTVKDACDNETTNTISVSGQNKVTLAMSADTTICLGGTANLRSTATVCDGTPTYQWTSLSANNGMQGTTNTNNISVIPTSVGDMIYNDTAYDANGCKVVESITVHVNDTATLTATNTSQTVCQGGNIAPIAIEYSNATLGYEYNSVANTLPAGLTITNHGDGKDTISGSITSAVSGETYTINILADNADDCADKSLTATITIDDVATVVYNETACDSYHWQTANEDRIFTASTDTVIGPYPAVNGCDSITNLHVVIKPNPEPVITGNPAICDGQSTTLSTTIAYSSYEWTGGSTDATLNVGVEGDYTVTVTDANGCSGTATFHVSVNDLPVPVITGRNVICDGETDTLTTTVGYSSYSWTGGSDNDTLFATDEGDYTVTVTDANGCEGSSAPFHVDVLDPITIAENTADATYCPNAEADSLSFTAHGGNGTYTYQWYLSTDGGSNYIEIAGANDTVYTPATDAAGSYTYKVEVGGDCGPTEQVIAVVTVREPLSASNSNNAAQYCLDATAAEIGVSATGGTGNYTFQWAVSTDSAAYSTVSTDSAYTPATDAAGTYYYRITVTDDQCGDTTLHVQTVTVWPQTTLELVGNLDQTKCVGGDIDSVQVIATNASTVNVTATVGTVSYNETTGNIGLTTSGNSGDEITITVTAVDVHSCHDSSLTFKVTLSDRTEFDTIITACGSVTWISANENITFTEDMDTVFGIAPNPVYHDMGGCDSVTFLHVNVHADVTPLINGPTSVCYGDTIFLSTADAYASYTWNDGTDTRYDTIVPATTGEQTYTVDIVTAEGCNGHASITVQVDTLPMPVINGVDILCYGGTTTLSTTSSYDNYNWSSGAPVVSATGDYTVTVTDGNGCEGTSAAFHVTVLDEITISENSADASYCPGDSADSLSFTAHGGHGGYSYQWQISTDGGANFSDIAGAIDTVYTPASNLAAGEYIYRVSVDDDMNCGPVEQVIATITIRTPIDVTNAITASQYCLNATASEIGVSAAGGSGNYTFQWAVSTDSAAFSNISTDSAYTPATTAAGTFYYRITVTDEFCGDTTLHVQTVTVWPQTTLDLVGDLDQTKCIGSDIDSVQVVATNASAVNISVSPNTIAYTYNGSTGNIGFTTEGNAGDEIIVSVTAVDEHFCHDSTLTFKVTLDATTVVNVNKEACGEYHWLTDNEDRLFTASIDTVIGPYPAVNGCDSITNLHVTINDNLSPVIAGRDAICAGETDTLTLTADYASYSWTGGSDNDTLFATDEGDYTVTVTDANGCSGTATFHVSVNDLPVPVITGRNVICDGETDTLTTTVGYSSYSWTGGSDNDTLFATDEGDYTVTVTDANGCEGSSAPFHVDVLDPITIAENTADATYCPNAEADSLSFTAHGGNGTYTYQWYLSTDGGSNYIEIAGANDTVYTPATDAAGSYTYKVEVGGDCGPTEQVIAVVTVREPLSASNSNNAAQYCLDATAAEIGVSATGGTGNYTFQWAVSTDSAAYSTVSTDSAYTPATDAAGTYYYRITVTDDQCGDTTLHVQTVTVWPQTTLELVGNLDQTKCVGGDIDSVQVIATNASTVSVSVEPNTISYAYNETTGNIGLTASGNEGDEIIVTVTAVDEHSCHDSTLTFKVTLSARTIADESISGCGSATWSSLAHPEEDSTFTESTDINFGPYTASDGCDSVLHLHVDVNGGTTPVFSLPDDVCVTASETNDSIEISVQALSGYTYEWSLDGGSYAVSSPHAADGISDTNIVIVRWTNQGDKTVTVTLTNLNNGCEGSESKTIHVHPVPAIAIAAVDDDICPFVGSQSLVATLTTETTADYTYNWGGSLTVTTTTQTTDATINEAVATIPASPCNSIYNVGVSVTDGYGCTATADSVTLTVRDLAAPTYQRPSDTIIYKDAVCAADITPEALGTISNLVEICSPEVDTSYTDVDVTPANACMGTQIIERRWRVVDLCGNVSTSDSVQTITLLDTVAPLIVGTMDVVTVEGCDESALPAVAATDSTVAYMISQGVTSVTDNCSDEAHLTVAISDGTMSGDCDHQVIRTYTVTDDCGNSNSTTQIITITRPAFQIPAIDTVAVTCEVDATAPTPLTVTLCGSDYTAHPVNTGDTNRVSAVVDGFLHITYNFEYTDCKGNYPWHVTYKVTPDEFTPVDSVYTTVACPSDIPNPIPVPTVTVCGEDIPFTYVDRNSSDTASCGDSIYNYTYVVNGTTYNWAYIVRFTPGDFTMPDDGFLMVSCPSSVVPPHTVAGRMPNVFNACGEDISTAYTLAAEPDEIPACEGTAVYTYNYEDCAGNRHEWHFTYTILREDFAITAEPGSATVACAADAIGAGEPGSLITLPTVMPVCDGEPALVPTDTIVSETPGCNGVMTYTYRYNDCTGNHPHDWVFTYTVHDTIAPVIAPIADQTAMAGGDCQYIIPDLSGLVSANDNCGDASFVEQSPAAGTRYDQLTNSQIVDVVITVTDNCDNLAYDTVHVTIPAKDVAVTVTPVAPSVCQGGSVVLTANGTSSAIGAGSYTWNPTNGLDAATGATVTASPSATTQYTVTYLDGNGCQATTSATVTVNPLVTLSADNLTQEVCAGGSISDIIVNYANAQVSVSSLPAGLTYNNATSTISGHPTASGNFTITATSLYGCEPMTLQGSITVSDTIRNFTEATACDAYVWGVNNATYLQSGVYRVQNVAQNGCVSLELLNLTVNHRSYGIDQIDACDSYTWLDGQTYTASTTTPTYTISGGNAAGCDSVVTLHLTVHGRVATDVSQIACDQYTWAGSTYTESTVVTQQLRSIYGCDSIVTMHLSIYPSYRFDTESDSICRGDYYNYHGNNYIETGVYTVSLRTHAGCDSIYTLNLTVLQPMTVRIEDDFDCKEGIYILNAVTESEYLRWSEYADHGQLSAQATSDTIRVAPPETTTYTVTVGFGPELMCPASESITLDELVVPVAAIETRPNYLSIDHNHWYADDTSVGETDGREWYVDGELYTQQSQHIDGEMMVNPFGDPDSVTLTLIVRSDRCADTAKTVIPLIWSEIWVPNVFTPSLDINNLFGAEGVGIIEMETWIFTREGLLVFHTTNMEEKWDGKHQSTGTDCKQDAYTYRVNYRFASKPEELQTKVGLVMLLR